ncbi:MAG TPA: HDOD domain-containing protein, partial [Vicinamibacterales bacterium]|nr:HDOD domain-containing protein [Vicinamibacterales bacterium]
LITLAADPETTVSQLTEIVSKDQVLASRLLSFANSAYCASAVEICSIPEAVMRVGAGGVRNLAVTACFTSRMQDPQTYGSDGRRLVDHGVGTAYLAHLIAEDADVNEDAAFLCGLLHDIGKLVILKWLYDARRRTGIATPEDVVAETVRHWHPTVAGLTFRRWNLPGDLDEPVMCHHDYRHATANRRLAATVDLANRLSHRYGFGCDVDREREVAGSPPMLELGLDEAWLADVDERAPGLFAVARQALS